MLTILIESTFDIHNKLFHSTPPSDKPLSLGLMSRYLNYKAHTRTLEDVEIIDDVFYRKDYKTLLRYLQGLNADNIILHVNYHNFVRYQELLKPFVCIVKLPTSTYSEYCKLVNDVSLIEEDFNSGFSLLRDNTVEIPLTLENLNTLDTTVAKLLEFGAVPVIVLPRGINRGGRSASESLLDITLLQDVICNIGNDHIDRNIYVRDIPNCLCITTTAVPPQNIIFVASQPYKVALTPKGLINRVDYFNYTTSRKCFECERYDNCMHLPNYYAEEVNRCFC